MSQKHTSMFVLELLSSIVWCLFVFLCIISSVISFAISEEISNPYTFSTDFLDADNLAYAESEEYKTSQISISVGADNTEIQKAISDAVSETIDTFVETLEEQLKLNGDSVVSALKSIFLFLAFFEIFCAVLYLLCMIRCLLRCRKWFKNPAAAANDNYVPHLICSILLMLLAVFSPGSPWAVLTFCPIATNIVGITKHYDA